MNEWPRNESARLSKLGVQLLSKIDQHSYRAFYAPEQLFLVVKDSQDARSLRAAAAIVDLYERNFVLQGFPRFLRAPVPHLIIREAVEPERHLGASIQHVFRSLEDEAAFYAKTRGRGRMKHRESYIEATKALSGEFELIGASLRVLAREAKLLASDVGAENLARARGRVVLYDFFVC